MSSINLSVQQLRQAASIKEKISALENQLSKLLGSTATTLAKAPKKKKGMSAAGRARVAAAQKARWAKIKSGKPVVKAAKPVVKTAKPAKKKGGMSAAGRARIAAAAKARWAAAKAAGKKTL